MANPAELRRIDRASRRPDNGPMAEAADPAAIARALLRQRPHAILCTAHGPDGAPYGSLVAVAPDADGAPLLFLSDLAEHTRNLARDPRAALVYAAAESDADPLSRPRATVMGRLARDDDSDRLARYIARHHAAEQYRTFGDFHLYRMRIARVHLVAGFGIIRWIEAGAVIDAR